MLDHVGISIPKNQFNDIVAWYLAALAPLGYAKHIDIPEAGVGLGPSETEIHLWIGYRSTPVPEGEGAHVAFRATTHAAVEEFHEAGLKAGGKCNGKPGIRAEYHPDYYAAFVLDPVG